MKCPNCFARSSSGKLFCSEECLIENHEQEHSEPLNHQGECSLCRQKIEAEEEVLYANG